MQEHSELLTWVVDLRRGRPVASEVCRAVGTDLWVGGAGGGHPAAVLTSGLAQEAHLEVRTRHSGRQVLVTTHQAVIAQVTGNGSLQEAKMGV